MEPEVKEISANVITRKIVKAAAFEAPIIFIAVLMIAFLGKEWMMAGIAMIVFMSFITAFTVLKAVSRIECPQCFRVCRKSGQLEYTCDACSIVWKIKYVKTRSSHL